MNDKSIPIKPCPFCGCELIDPYKIAKDSKYGELVGLMCNACQAKGPAVWNKTREEMSHIKAWNKRYENVCI